MKSAQPSLIRNECSNNTIDGYISEPARSAEDDEEEGLLLLDSQELHVPSPWDDDDQVSITTIPDTQPYSYEQNVSLTEERNDDSSEDCTDTDSQQQDSHHIAKDSIDYYHKSVGMSRKSKRINRNRFVDRDKKRLEVVLGKLQKYYSELSHLIPRIMRCDDRASNYSGVGHVFPSDSKGPLQQLFK